MTLAPAHGVLWPEGEAWSHKAGLERLKQRGWRPRCVYDIGASSGFWSLVAAQPFPLAEFHLFEPLSDLNASYRDGLTAFQARPGIRATVHCVALDTFDGTSPMGVGNDPMGSSLLVKEAGPYFPSVVEIQCGRLDTYRAQHQLPAPDLIKIDTQGSELRVLEGAQDTLRLAELVIIETWVDRAYGPATPLLHEVVAWLHPRGFHVIDAVGGYREAAKLLSVDLAFARDDAQIDRR